MDGHLHQTFPLNQPDCETQHEAFPGSCGRGDPCDAVKWIRPLFPENCVRPIAHQHLSERGGAHQSERATHLCIELRQVPGGARMPGRAQRAERLQSPQHNQGAIYSALGQHPQYPRERGAGAGALTPVVPTGGYAPPLENGLARLTAIEVRGLRLALGPGVQRGRFSRFTAIEVRGLRLALGPGVQRGRFSRFTAIEVRGLRLALGPGVQRGRFSRFTATFSSAAVSMFSEARLSTTPPSTR